MFYSGAHAKVFLNKMYMCKVNDTLAFQVRIYENSTNANKLVKLRYIYQEELDTRKRIQK